MVCVIPLLFAASSNYSLGHLAHLTSAVKGILVVNNCSYVSLSTPYPSSRQLYVSGPVTLSSICPSVVTYHFLSAGINVDNFISITGWLLGPSATKVLRLLPSVIGKISLGIFEVERVRHAHTSTHHIKEHTEVTYDTAVSCLGVRP